MNKYKKHFKKKGYVFLCRTHKNKGEIKHYTMVIKNWRYAKTHTDQIFLPLGDDNAVFSQLLTTKELKNKYSDPSNEPTIDSFESIINGIVGGGIHILRVRR